MAKVKKSEKTVTDNKVAKVVNLTISVGDDDSARLLPELVAAIKEALTNSPVSAKSVTVTGQHYLILNGGSGKLCREMDYDPDTRDFRPGTFPPAWAGGGPETTRATKDIESGAGVGARNPEHLRTVQETLAARAGKSAKKLRMKSAQSDSGQGNTRSGKNTPPPVEEDIEIDLDAIDSGAEEAAEEASSSLLLKLKRGKS